jgi:hypothetical protein
MTKRSFLAAMGGLCFWRPKLEAKEKVIKGDVDRDVVMVAVGEASMCWEHPERAGVFDTAKAIEVGNGLYQALADGVADFATARMRMKDDLSKDVGLFLGYRANIACILHDRDGLSWTHANQTADAIMNLVFDMHLPIVSRTLGEQLDKFADEATDSASSLDVVMRG